MTTTLDWYGCATFRLRTAGVTVFLDAYIDRAPNADGPGLMVDDVDQCDWIVIGHLTSTIFGAQIESWLVRQHDSLEAMRRSGFSSRLAFRSNR